ncbi:MAG: hypothetical protein HYY37_05455 [Candidatus Aenigmarchaeota archaeon]|nr:hypothetical protein [Candidatus Aenigmarchaeota archaeon]
MKKDRTVALWFSGGFGLIGIWHVLMVLLGIDVSFPGLGVTLDKSLHLLIFVLFGAVSVLLYRYGTRKR